MPEGWSEPRVFLVGAGPGDPGLLTLRGRELLAIADVVLHDALVHPALLEHCPQAERVFVGKRYGEESASQEEITRRLIAEARSGRRVVRLKGGDPLLFARGSEEAEALADAGIPFEVVPGISSPVAVSAYAGFSLTHRDLSSSVTFITGHQRAGVDWSPEQWRKLATATDTLCILMGMKRIEEITAAVLEGGRDPETPALVVQWGARAEQRVVSAPLHDIARTARAAGLRNPALIFVGEVVKLREKLQWWERRPLFGRRLLVPRAAEQARETCEAVRARGAEPVAVPLIEIAPPPEPARLLDAVRRLSSWEWVAFTSANGVRRCFEALDEAGLDVRAFGGTRIATIGPRTAAALSARGLRADVVAEEFVGESLAAALTSRGARRVLILRALVARDVLPESLRASGAEVDVVVAYETRHAPGALEAVCRLQRDGGLDAVLLTSSSIAARYAELAGERPELRDLLVASIGPVTTATALERALPVAVTASTYTVEGLLDALGPVLGRRASD